MGFLQDIAASIGGADLNRLASGNANLDDPHSPDHQHLLDMLKNIDPNTLPQIFGRTAETMGSQEYSNHVTPGVGGTNPLGNLPGGALGTIASLLVGCLMKNLGGKGGPSPLDKVPGLRTQDPQEMDAGDVAAVARYTQQNHPQVFAETTTQIAKKQPELLHSFLGKAALAVGAAALASHFIKLDPR